MWIEIPKRFRSSISVLLSAALLAPAAVRGEDMVPADLVLELLKVAPRYGADDPTLIVGKEEVLVHYGAQLGEQGWQPDTRIDYDSLAYQSWLYLDEAGKEWHGFLRVQASPHDESQLKVEFEVTYLERA